MMIYDAKCFKWTLRIGRKKKLNMWKIADDLSSGSDESEPWGITRVWYTHMMISIDFLFIFKKSNQYSMTLKGKFFACIRHKLYKNNIIDSWESRARHKESIYINWYNFNWNYFHLHYAFFFILAQLIVMKMKRMCGFQN